jgi:hypothetical protein
LFACCVRLYLCVLLLVFVCVSVCCLQYRSVRNAWSKFFGISASINIASTSSQLSSKMRFAARKMLPSQYDGDIVNESSSQRKVSILAACADLEAEEAKPGIKHGHSQSVSSRSLLSQNVSSRSLSSQRVSFTSRLSGMMTLTFSTSTNPLTKESEIEVTDTTVETVATSASNGADSDEDEEQDYFRRTSTNALHTVEAKEEHEVV